MTPKIVHEPPASDLEAKLSAVWRRVLDLRAVGVTENFFELGGHSVAGVRLVTEIEKDLGIAVPLATLMRAQTIREMASEIEGGGPEAGRWPLITRLRAGDRRAALFLVATPNANALGYASLARHLTTEHPVYVLQRRYAEEAALGRPYTAAEIDGWAASYLEAVRAVQPEGPYLFAGMCIGAFIALSMARTVEAEGSRVALLGMLDTWPDENTRDPLLDRVFVMEQRLKAVARLPVADRVRWAANRLGRAVRKAVTGPRPEEDEAVAQWQRRNFPGASFDPPKVGCRISVFRTEKQPYWRIDDDALGWRAWTRAGVDVRPIAGKHPLFMREPEVRVLALQLDLALRANPVD